LKFTKMQGIGNDFIMVDCLKDSIAEDQIGDISRKVNNRKFGVGGDGLILILPSKVAELRMRMFNPDGSEAEMCGNGIRCFARYAYERKIVDDTQLRVETAAGQKTLKLLTRGGKVEAVRVDMGQPRFRRSEIPMRGDDSERVVREPLKVDGRKFDITAVSMGNPHVVIFEENVSSFDLERYGPQIEHHRAFPQRTNVHFVQVCSTSELVVRTWERGAGATLACGTGACATAVAASLNDRTGKRVHTHLPGGDLLIEWNGDNRVHMTGPAEFVFEGEIDV
jgi:diaminopimelate epimerase